MKLSEVQIGMKINHPRHGEGIITGKTARTISATFVKGITAKVTYKTADAYFYVTDF
ncbi:hypothetical protein [Chryseobacterium sp. 2R14A]|uniref:hypothetical protein n=1 Tax=Chryseobacterium sp. 2R14A TaxID=3380353 RepID=UPI003CF1FEB4